jgi:lysozyme
MTRPVPQCALQFLKGAEAVRLTAYLDSAAVPTIGVGHTGPEVHLGMTITPSQSDAYLFADATKAATRLALMVKAEVIEALSEHQYAALISFVFNLGTPKSTLWGLLNARNFAAVPAKMMEFDKARVKGRLVELPGLYNRRAAEVALWKTADVAAATAMVQAVPPTPPSSYTRAADTPEAQGSLKPNSRSKSFIASAVTACAATAAPFVNQIQAGAQTVNKTLEPYIGGSEILQHVHENLTIGLAVLAVLTVVLVGLKNKGMS